MAEKPTRKAMLEQARQHLDELAGVDDPITEGEWDFDKMENSQEYKETLKKYYEQQEEVINENLQRLKEFIEAMEIHLVEMTPEEQDLFIQIKRDYDDINGDARAIFREPKGDAETMPLRIDDRPGNRERYAFRDPQKIWKESKEYVEKNHKDDRNKDALTMILYFDNCRQTKGCVSHTLNYLTDEGEEGQFKKYTERFEKYTKEFVQLAQADKGMIRHFVAQPQDRLDEALWQRFEENPALFVSMTQAAGRDAEDFWNITAEMTIKDIEKHAEDFEKIFETFDRYPKGAVLYFMAIGKKPLHENEVTFLKATLSRLWRNGFRDIEDLAARREEIIEDPAAIIKEIMEGNK